MADATILVVEDEPILGLELREDLTSFGYSVPEVVSDGDGVMVAVLKHQPKLIIMDIKLHGYRDGIEAVHRLRAFYDTPVIYLSSHRHSEVAARIAKTPNCRYLEKPYNKARLVSVIQSSLSENSADAP